MGQGTVATPTLTADIVLFCSVNGHASVLLIQRKKEPFAGCWALPGGKLDIGETVEDCASRELVEETGIRHVKLQQFRVFSEPERDPRGHYISVAFYGVLYTVPTSMQAGDDAQACQWFSIDTLPNLAFDHAEIVVKALSHWTLRETSNIRARIMASMTQISAQPFTD